MTTRREAILSRLEQILKTVPNAVSVWRNRAALANDMRPALYLLDGDETNPFANQGTNRGRGPNKGFPYILHMTPQVHVALENRSTEDNKDVGPDLNTFLKEIQDRISNDTQLHDLVTPNGDIVYLGLQSDLGVGRTMAGQYQINWRLQYPAKMDQLSIV